MSIFDQRMLKPCSDIFYFQLIPTNIVPYDTHNISDNDWPQLTIFKLYKGNPLNYQGQLLCDQTKKPVPVAIVNQNIIISRVYLNFNVPVKDQEKQTQFTIKIYGVRSKNQQIKQNQDQDKCSENQKLSNNRKLQQNLFEIGNCILASNKYMKQNQISNTQQFHETYKINEHFSLQFQLFVAKSRFALQRYVKKSRQQRRKQDRKQLPNYNELEQYLIHNNLNDERSQVSRNQLIHNGEAKFITGDKRIIADRKLIVRNHSSAKKTNIINLQQDMKRDIKSADKSYLNIKLQNKNQIKQNFTRRSNTNEGISQEKTDISKKLFKIDAEANKKRADLNIKNVQQIKNKATQKLKSKKQQTSQLYCKEKNQHVEKNKQKDPTNININFKNLLDSKIFLLGFTIIAFILLLNVMSPSKKV